MHPTESPIPILDISWADQPDKKPDLLKQLHAALFDVGFLYIKNHGVPQSTISNLTNMLPDLFNLPESERAALSKLNSPHFLGYSGFAEETTLGKQDLREQFDYATELPVVYQDPADQSTNDRTNGKGDELDRDFSKLYWRLRGPNQWPSESSLPGFRQALTAYHDAVQELSYRFVHLIEEAFGIPVGTFDHFFGRQAVSAADQANGSISTNGLTNGLANGHSLSTKSAQLESTTTRSFLPPQHRLKLLKYPPPPSTGTSQGVGAHKDSSGWLTFLYQVGSEPGLEVLSTSRQSQQQGEVVGEEEVWLPVPPIPGTFVVNFGNALEAATEGAVRATIHRVIAPPPIDKGGRDRYSIPFFQGLPLDLTVSEVRKAIPDDVRRLRRREEEVKGKSEESGVSSFLDPRWDSLGESQLRKWVRSHSDVAEKWYGKDVVEYYCT